jgi:hypothetical protein
MVAQRHGEHYEEFRRASLVVIGLDMSMRQLGSNQAVPAFSQERLKYPTQKSPRRATFNASRKPL